MSTTGRETSAGDVSEQVGHPPSPATPSLLTELSETKRYAERLSRLHRFESEIHQVESKEALFEHTADCMRELFDVQRASVTLVNESRISFDIYALNQDIAGSTLVGSTIPLAGTAVGVTIAEDRLMNLPDVSSSHYTDYQSLYRDGMHSIINAPLSLNGRTIGSVNMAAKRPRAFNTVDEEILQRMTQSVARGLHHRRLTTEALHASQENRETMALMDRLGRLNEAAYALNSALTRQQALEFLASYLGGIVPFARGQVILVTEAATRQVFTMQQARIQTQPRGEPPSHVLDTDFQSIIEAQLLDGHREIGVLRLQHEGLQSYTDRDRQLLSQTAALFAATLRNIRLLEDARRAQSAAEASSAAKSTFVANISHEIRTPLNAIIGMTSLLASSELDGEKRQFVETIRSSSENLLDVVNEVLDFSKIEANKVELEEQPFELKRCVEDVVDLFSTPAALKSLEITQQLDENVPPFVIGDVTRLRQVLVNLVGNATKFTDNGWVRIHASLQSQPTPQNALIQFTVSDSGIGMTDAQLDSLFEPFVQGDSSMTRRYGGTGLGLVIARHLVELMGGQIWAESKPERGSQFHFTVKLRITKDAKAAISRQRKRRSDPTLYLGSHLAQQHPLNILVAEDNKVNQLVMLNILKRLGYRADVAADGLEVLDAIDRQTYEVILMDMQMPHMDGLSATTQIRTRRGQSKSPQIIAVTANATEDDAKACLQAGMNDYLSKPVQIKDLVKALAAAAQRIPAAKA